MPRGHDLIGLPVLAWPQLRRIGQVCEVLISAEGTSLCGLVLDKGGWLHHRRVLDYQAVITVGPTHLLAEERYLSNESRTRSCQELLGLPVLNRAGEELGVMDDFQFDPRGGRVTALQLSRGLVDDLLNGKVMIALPGPVTAGEAAILLDGPGDSSGGALH